MFYESDDPYEVILVKKKLNEKDLNSDKEFEHAEKNSKQYNFVNIAVFLFSLSIVLFSLISVVFPALIASSNSVISELEDLGIVFFEVDIYEQGIWAIPLFVINFVVFGLTFLYFKKKLPKSFIRSIDFVFNFEISKRVAFIVIVILLSIYVIASAPELTKEEQWEDYPGVKKRVENWSPDQVSSNFEPHITYFFIWTSMILFGNLTVIPFLTSISLLLLIYFFTKKITEKLDFVLSSFSVSDIQGLAIITCNISFVNFFKGTNSNVFANVIVFYL